MDFVSERKDYRHARQDIRFACQNEEPIHQKWSQKCLTVKMLSNQQSREDEYSTTTTTTSDPRIKQTKWQTSDSIIQTSQHTIQGEVPHFFGQTNSNHQLYPSHPILQNIWKRFNEAPRPTSIMQRHAFQIGPPNTWLNFFFSRPADNFLHN